MIESVSVDTAAHDNSCAGGRDGHGDVRDEDEYVDPRVARTRRAVVDAAADLLLEHGPDAVTHARIADTTTYSRTTLYKHWPSRTDLIRAAMDKIDKNRMVRPTSGDLRTDLRSTLDGLARDLRDESQLRMILTMIERSRHDESVAAVRDDLIDEIEPIFDEVLQRAVDAGELRADLDVSLGWASLVGGLMFRKFLFDDPLTDDTVERLIDEFITANTPR